MRFLTVGTALTDIVVKPISPKVFEGTIQLENVQFLAGGDAMNASRDLAILGEESRIVTCLGRDASGERNLQFLQEAGVDTRYVLFAPEGVGSTTSLVLIDAAGDRYFGYCPGSNDHMRESDVTDEAIAWADHVHIASVMRLTGMDGAGTYNLFKRAHAMGKTTSMDATKDLDGIWMGKVEQVLHECDIFIPSDYEVNKICGLTDPVAMKEFFRPYGLKVFGVKLGAKGVYLTNYKEDVWMPTFFKGTPVDTTGAGDAFCATFIAAYKRGLSLASCGAVATAASCGVISQIGTIAGMRSFDALCEVAEQNGYPVK